MMHSPPQYLIISPVRNEGKWIAQTIESVISQTIPPSEYILVDDCSDDNTVEVIKTYLAKVPWLRLIELPPREPLPTAQAVVRAFEIGYRQRNTITPDFLIKLDGDLSFSPTYFEQCFQAFIMDPKLGLTGGTIRTQHGDLWVTEKVPLHHVRGATKVYRWECWQDIGGLVPRHGWDGIDILRAQLNGWESRHLENLIVYHYRPAGKRQGGVSVRIERGETAYYLGSHPLHVFFSGIRRMADWPYVLGGLGIIYGYLSARFRRIPQIDDPELISFNRWQQMKRMSFGLIGRKTRGKNSDAIAKDRVG